MIHSIRRPLPLRPLLVWLAVFMLGLSLPGCSHWRDSYLKGAVQEATQEEIVKKLGEPWKKKTSLLNGHSTWIYRYALTKEELDPMGVNTLGRNVSKTADSVAGLIGFGGGSAVADKPKCFHYVLTFNQANVLQTWVREPCANTAL